MEKIREGKMDAIIEFFERLGPVLVALIAVIPGTIALIIQRRGDKDKLNTEKGIREAAVAKQVQEIYQEIVDDVKKQSDECKAIVAKLSSTVKEISDQNEELLRKNKSLLEEINLLRKDFEELQRKLEFYEREA